VLREKLIVIKCSAMLRQDRKLAIINYTRF